MKKKKKGWIAIPVLVLIAALAAGGYFFLRDGGAGSGSEGTVYVQSVAEILGVGYAGIHNQYAGVVEAKDVIKINPDQNLTIEKRYVEAGDPVKEGDPLFSYDVESMTLAYEQLLIDITGLENSIQTDTEELASLEKQIAKAKESKVYELKLRKQTVELNIRKNTYELANKKQKAADTKAAIENSVVASPVTGTIRSVNDPDVQTNYYYYGGDSQSNDYITIVAGTDFCIKCTVSEQTIHTLSEGMPALIRSRTDRNLTYVGRIYKINTEPESNNNSYYYEPSNGEQASKYAFYVEVDTIEGLLVGQHVYVEPGRDGSGQKQGVLLPEYYLVQEEGKAYVFVQGSGERIEKREVTLGQYQQDTMSYEITSGLSLTDKIAYPDDTVQAGMKCSTTVYNGDGGMEEGIPEEQVIVPSPEEAGGAEG